MSEQRHVRLFAMAATRRFVFPWSSNYRAMKRLCTVTANRLVIEPVASADLFALIKTMKRWKRIFPRSTIRCRRRGRCFARYMLDTNIISDLIRNPQGKAAEAGCQRWARDNICTSIIVAASCVRMRKERLETAAQGRRGPTRRNQRAAFDVPADAEYGGIRSGLEAAESRSAGNDLPDRRSRPCGRATIVTANAGEFKNVSAA